MTQESGGSTARLTVILAGGAALCLAGLWILPAGVPAIWPVTPLLLVAAAALVLAHRARRQCVEAVAEQERQHQRASQLRMATVEALALAIDARDRSSRSQIRRELACAGALAEAFGMSPAEADGVRTAALLHDIGKLAVPDHILIKPGPLTPEETGKVRVHSQVGADILANVPFPSPVASLVLCHHERWDGTGYPAGLKGDKIPLGARILSVVDQFDALTSDRPFHEALPSDEALAVLWREAGRALDPAVVARFAQLLPSLQLARAGASEALPDRSASPAASAGQAAALPSSSHIGPSVLDRIALAHQEIHALYDVAQALGTSLGVADAMTVIASKLGNLVSFSNCALFLHDTTEGMARCRFATGPDMSALRPLVVPVGSGVIGATIARREIVVNGDPSADLALAGSPVAAPSLKSVLAFPLIVGDAVVGALALYHGSPGHFTDEHRRLVTRILHQAATVIANSLAFEQTQEESVTDPLTNLPNTRYLFLHLKGELARSSRQGSSVSLLLFDLDNLKDINDTYGHHAGDRALREVASVLRRAIRPYDTVVRYGGDEFIVVLSDCDAEEAEVKRVELQQAVDALPFVARGSVHVRLAVSVGAAVFPEDGDNYEALLAVADARMYRDKDLRKHPNGHNGGHDSRSGSVSDVDLQRAAAGVL